MVDLENLITEQRNKNTFELDQMSINEAARIMNEEDQGVPHAVEKALPQIENVINAATKSLKEGGRVIYIGAGTSGRLGVLDAAESVPTFGVDSNTVVGIIAGGEKAMINAVEGAEDDLELGKKDLKKINLSNKDLVVGVAASGRTPYVIGALEYATGVGATTSSISCNLNSEISKYVKLSIEVDCGPEFLTGSTRLKAATAQKLILNMISTISMIGIGKVYKNLMVDVKPTNEKLNERSKHIIMDATGCSYELEEEKFEESGHNVKLAIVMILTDLSKDMADYKLKKANGFVRDAIK